MTKRKTIPNPNEDARVEFEKLVKSLDPKYELRVPHSPTLHINNLNRLFSRVTDQELKQKIKDLVSNYFVDFMYDLGIIQENISSLKIITEPQILKAVKSRIFNELASYVGDVEKLLIIQKLNMSADTSQDVADFLSRNGIQTHSDVANFLKKSVKAILRENDNKVKDAKTNIINNILAILTEDGNTSIFNDLQILNSENMAALARGILFFNEANQNFRERLIATIVSNNLTEHLSFDAKVLMLQEMIKGRQKNNATIGLFLLSNANPPLLLVGLSMRKLSVNYQ
jgi:hypothetical protein